MAKGGRGRYREAIEMTEKDIDTAEIYDNPVSYMTVKGVFGYAEVDLIPFRATMRRDTIWN